MFLPPYNDYSAWGVAASHAPFPGLVQAPGGWYKVSSLASAGAKATGTMMGGRSSRSLTGGGMLGAKGAAGLMTGGSKTRRPGGSFGRDRFMGDYLKNTLTQPLGSASRAPSLGGLAGMAPMRGAATPSRPPSMAPRPLSQPLKGFGAAIRPRGPAPVKLSFFWGGAAPAPTQNPAPPRPPKPPKARPFQWAYDPAYRQQANAYGSWLRADTARKDPAMLLRRGQQYGATGSFIAGAGKGVKDALGMPFKALQRFSPRLASAARVAGYASIPIAAVGIPMAAMWRSAQPMMQRGQERAMATPYEQLNQYRAASQTMWGPR